MMELTEIVFNPILERLPSAQNIEREEPDFIIDPEWNKLVEPVSGLSDFDPTRPIPSIDVNMHNGKMTVIDGRKRVIACRGRYPLGYRIHYFTPRRAKAEFLKRHKLLEK